MNIDEVISAAQKIKHLRDLQAERTRAWQDLARDAKSGLIPRETILARSRQLDSGQVVDFSTAVEELCDAVTQFDNNG